MYILKKTYNEVVVSLVHLIDFFLPDFTILTPVRSLFYRLIANVGSWTRLRKWQYVLSQWTLSIWKNCYLNRWNIFDTNQTIQIWNNCSIGYDNYFITSSHYERWSWYDEVEFTTTSKPIKVWNWVWITTWCKILPWVSIWDNCIIAAWAVVISDCSEWWLYWWVPAKRLKETKGFIYKKA